MDFDSILLAKKLGGGGGGDITPEIKTALLGCFSKVAWIDENGQDYYNTLRSALYRTASLESISAVYTQSGTVYDTDTLDSLKSDLVVTANWSDSSTSTVDSNYYTLSGTLTEGTSTITVTYLEKTTTFSVTVTENDPYVFLKGYSVVAIGSNNTNVKIRSDSKRVALSYKNGVNPYPLDTGTIAETTYPIPIPQGTSQMQVSMPSALYVGARVIHWTGSQYNTDYGSSWTASNTSTFNVSSYNDGTYFASFTFKVGTAGTTDMTNYDMSDVSISFE